MNIELTEKEVQFLTEFAQKQHEGAHDNLGTCTPIPIVERADKHFVSDDSSEIWIDIDNEYEHYNSFDELIETQRKSGKDLPNYDDVEFEEVNEVWIDSEKAYCEAYSLNVDSGRYIISYRPVAFFFIRDEAVRYKDGYQKHNCTDCRIYTYGLGYSNNGDMPVFRNLLLRMGTELINIEEY